MTKNTSCQASVILEIAILEPKYPDPILPPSEVEESRKSRYKALLRSSFQGIGARTFIVLFELGASLLFGSASLFMDALSTSLDIVTSLALVISFKFAARPPDTNHPFGHGRFEPLAGFQLGVFLAILGGVMFFYNFSEVSNNQASTINPFLWVVPFTSVFILEICYRNMMRTAKKQNSPALAADAAHYRIDSMTSLFAMIALISASFLPQFSQLFDHVGAALIALFMVGVGINAARSNMHQILDRIPHDGYFEKVKEAASRAVGVLGTEKIRIQQYGPDAYIGIDIEVDPELSVKVAHGISQKVRYEIQKELPEVRDVMVHVEPFYPNDH
jgi:cation diffusion facilitator family transporter